MKTPASGPGACVPYGLQLRVGGGISPFLPPVAPLANDFSVPNNNTAYGHIPLCLGLHRQLQSPAHILFMIHPESPA